MLELDAHALLGATTNLARVHQIFSDVTEAQADILIPQSVAAIVPPIQAFKIEASKLGARLAVVLADRLLERLGQQPCILTVGAAVQTINEIESRFADYLTEVKFFALDPIESIFTQSADGLMQREGFSVAYPQTSFEFEEAAKCIAFGRHTAAVFHAMRALEIAIRALAKRLSIPDPAKAAEKNWARILEAIRGRIDELWPRSSRMPGSEGAVFEELYAHLDAVRNPWRNSTMHVETIYAPHEALHILRCSAFFVTKLFNVTDEDGRSPEDPMLPTIETD